MTRRLTRPIRTVDDRAPLPLPRLPGETYTETIMTFLPGEYVLQRRGDGSGLVDLVRISTAIRRADEPLPIYAMTTAYPTGDGQRKGPPTLDGMNEANRRFWENPR